MPLFCKSPGKECLPRLVRGLVLGEGNERRGFPEGYDEIRRAANGSTD
jgi:hypothetical protein